MSAQKRTPRKGGYPRSHPMIGPGRPATVNIPERLLHWVQERAEKDDVSRSEVVVAALLAWACNRGFRIRKAA